MSKNSTKQSGSMVAGIIAAVLVIGIVGFIGWRLLTQPTKQTNNATSSNQTTSKTPPSSNNQDTTPVQQTDPNAGYFVITEWGVRFKPVSSLTNVEYALRNSSDIAVFSTQQLTASDANCSTQASGSSGIGSVTRTTIGSTAPFGGTLLTTVNGYDYYYEGVGGASCITNPNNSSGRTLMQNAQTDFSSSIKSLEAAK